MKKIFIGFVFISINLFAQVNEESLLTGIITYKTNSKVNVSFKSTEGIEKGDTLFVKSKSKMVPALVVASLSGTSCTGKSIVPNLDIDTKIYVLPKTEFSPLNLIEEKNNEIAAGISEPIHTGVIPATELNTSNESNDQINKNKRVEIIRMTTPPDSEITSANAEIENEPTIVVNSPPVNISSETPTDNLKGTNEDKPVEKSEEKVIPDNSTTASQLIILSETPREIIKKKKEEESGTKKLKSNVTGKISVQSYSNLSNLSRELSYQRWRYAFQLSANNIGSTKLSYSHYLNFAYRANDWNRISSNLGEAFRIYDLSLRYDFNSKTNIVAGRHINRKVSNVSMVDGLQFETGISSWSFGLITGARPDYRNLGFNLKLFEYGAYIYKTDTLGYGNMQNTISFFEQTNNSKTDRRFFYFQHTNSAIRNTRIFLSSEVDLFKKELGVGKSDFSLTSLYASVNVRPSDIISFNLSYDARKNVIYYETFKTFADSVFENESRQGFRARISLRAVKGLYINGNYGYRFRKGDAKPSRNYGGSISYYKIPVVDLRITTDFSWLSTNYVDGTIWGVSLSRDILNGANLSVDYRNTVYDFNKSVDNLKQHSVSMNLSLSLLRPVFLGLSYEGVFEKTRTSGRLLTNLSYRF